MSGKFIHMGFASYFGHKVNFLLAPRTRKKRALIVAAFTLLLSVSLETYIYIIWNHSVIKLFYYRARQSNSNIILFSKEFVSLII